jgi:16S rRNA (cytidine1402-2'-O)-methyltransferase
VVEGAKPAPAADAAMITLDAALTALLPEHSVSNAAAVAAKLTGAKRNDAYARALELAGSRDK